ncbi:putative tail fiber domain protein [Acinetobacter baumannii 1457504]|nr:putative tail fiber domain protein [Acinetobacter baumannii 1457504]
MNLGLGTAAVLASTTSQYDPTPGRALRVGDWGIGAEGSRVSDMVAPLNNGFFRTDDTLTNDTGNSIGPYGFFYTVPDAQWVYIQMEVIHFSLGKLPHILP